MRERMTELRASIHKDLEAEQAYIDYAYARLNAMIQAAERLRDTVIGDSSGGTHQARYQRDVIVQTSLERLEQLDIGEEALCFGRTDSESEETFYIGRRAVYGESQEPVVIDWRVPAAAPFYRATGLHPLDLTRRRHFACKSNQLLDLEDELFSGEQGGDLGLAGTGALLGALERSRSGHMRDIVATVQKEQDEIIRADLPGVLAVQGGPGTGKTAVALHRAAYLLFTHRKKLGRDGILFIGPNRLFLRYIDRVLPALGETGAALSTPSGLVGGTKVTLTDPAEAARIKGDERMAQVMKNAIKARQRPVARDVVIRYRHYTLNISRRTSQSVVSGIKRARGTHNALRSNVEQALFRRLHGQYVAAATRFGNPGGGTLSRNEFARDMVEEEAVMEALDYMWPRLTPHKLIDDLFADRALLDQATNGVLSPSEARSLAREAGTGWSAADMALIDEAAVGLGSMDIEDDDEDRHDPDDLSDSHVSTYGHIVVDEVQDLSPMQLRMIGRRSRAGSMTLVGDMAQSTASAAAGSWEAILRHLPSNRNSRVEELSINYRTPAEIMDCAASVLSFAAPHLKPPRSVRSTGRKPDFIEVDKEALMQTLADVSRASLEETAEGTVAIICPEAHYAAAVAALRSAGIVFGEASEAGLSERLTLISPEAVKGLEFDSVILVEPALIVSSVTNGLRALYVALTRATRHLAVLHSAALPAELSCD